MNGKTAIPKLLVPITKKLISVFKRGDWRMGLRPRYQTKTAPCQANCPAGNDIRGWLALLKNGQVKEAAELVQKTSPFPGVCGFICPRFCEANCNRKDFDEAVAINKLENKLGFLRLTLWNINELESAPASKRAFKNRRHRFRSRRTLLRLATSASWISSDDF